MSISTDDMDELTDHDPDRRRELDEMIGSVLVEDDIAALVEDGPDATVLVDDDVAVLVDLPDSFLVVDSTAVAEEPLLVSAVDPSPGTEGATDGGGGEPATAPKRRHRVRRIVWRVLLSVVLAVVAVVGHSLYGALRAPGSDSITARVAEWTRDHGGTPIVNFAERLTYKPPKVGGTPTRGIPTGLGEGAVIPADAKPLGPHLPRSGPLLPKMGPHRPGTEPTTIPRPAVPAGPVHLADPAPIAPVADPPIPDEGTWQVLQTANGLPAVRATFLRADAVYTSYVAAVAWMDTKLLHLELHPGTGEPGGGPWPHGPSLPPSERTGIVAAFNSGFRMADSRGGFYEGGRTSGTLRDGAASIVFGEDGTVKIGQWGRDFAMDASVYAVRQNLDLIVDGGEVSRHINDNSGNRWGATLGNDLYVWRSGVGITADGALLFASGPRLSAATLAQLLVRAGAVRGMELDINPQWTIFVHYSMTPEGSIGNKLLSTMSRPASVYDSTSSRDFIVARSR